MEQIFRNSGYIFFVFHGAGLTYQERLAEQVHAPMRGIISHQEMEQTGQISNQSLNHIIIYNTPIFYLLY